MSKLSMLLVFVFLLSMAGLAAAQCASDNAPIFTKYRGDGDITFSDKSGDEWPCCPVGNGTPYGGTWADVVTGNQSFSYGFGVQPVCGYSEGFKLVRIQMWVNFEPEDVPVTLDVAASFEETQWDEQNQRLVPGPPICTSPTFTGTVTEPGPYLLSIPIAENECACAEFGWPYAISVHFLSTVQSPFDILTDAQPTTESRSWIDEGRGWEPLDSMDPDGELKMWAKLIPCSEPVPDDAASWGEVKSLYR